MPGSASAVRTRSESPPVSGRYASGTAVPVQAATRRRLNPAILRSSRTVSGSTPAPITMTVATAVNSSTPRKRYDSSASPPAVISWAVARPARRTVSPMGSG